MQEQIVLQRTLRVLPVEAIRPWPDNPASRLTRNRQFRELVDHIRANGQIDPIDVAPSENHPLQIVRGHRRYQAIAKELGWPFIDAWVWFEPFEVVLPKLLPTERMQRSWFGIDKGQATIALGLERVQGLYRDEDVLILQWAASQLVADPEAFRWLCLRFGPRVFARLKPLVSKDWPFPRICRAVRAKGAYRDLEAKGLAIEKRWSILEGWEALAM